MTDLTASGWQASAITVLRSYAGYGARSGRENLVQIKIFPDDHTGGSVYPSNGWPAPGPSMVGLREINYVIPVSPFFPLKCPVTTYGGAVVGAGASDGKCFIWGAYMPTFSASGVTSAAGPISLRLVGGIPLASGTGDPTWAGANPSFADRGYLREPITNIPVSSFAPTTAAACLVGYAIFGEM